MIVEAKGLRVDLSRAAWKKSSYSNASGCVEVAFVDGAIAVRDSKDPQRADADLHAHRVGGVRRGVHDGEFD